MTFGARIGQAFFASALAAVTLALYPVAMLIFGAAYGGGGGAMESAVWVGKVVFSRLGVAAMCLAAVAGFIISPARLADVFSFFWGTHPFWGEADEWVRENVTPGWVAFLLVVVAAIVIWWQLWS